jgi:hypothetical protein
MSSELTAAPPGGRGFNNALFANGIQSGVTMTGLRQERIKQLKAGLRD